MTRLLIFAHLAGVIGLAACSSDLIIAEDVTAGSDYIPVSEGKYWVYHVSETEHYELTDDIHLTYQVREEIDQIMDNGDYRAMRYIRDTELDDWQVDSAFVMRKTERQYIRVEQNIPLTKLVFPLAASNIWDINEYNTRDEDHAEVISIDAPYQLGGQMYDHTVGIQLQMDNNLLYRDFRYEYYAKNVGLVHKLIEDYKYINDSGSEFWGQDSVIGGRYEEWRLVESGGN